MERRDFIRTLTTGSVGLTGLAGASVKGSRQPANPGRPNILVILADDMGYSDIGLFGSEIRTPNIDRLGSNGVSFNQFYNAARCCPTRASLLTGLYPHQSGIGLMLQDLNKPGYRGELSDNSVTMAQALKANGYSTSLAGKWHLTNVKRQETKENWPLQRGFDRFYGFMYGACDYYKPVGLTYGNEYIEPEERDFYFTDAITDHALEFMGEHIQGEQPFFQYLAYTAPHWPLHALEEDINRYEGTYDVGWDQIREQRYQNLLKNNILNEEYPLAPRDPRINAWEKEEHRNWEARRMAVYAAQVDRMDQNIGRVLNYLEKKGELDNTLIFFLADNGGAAERLSEGWSYLPAVSEKTRDGRPVKVGNKPDVMPGPPDTYQSYGIGWANASNTPFRLYKHWIHEGGISTPLLMHWPKGITRPGHMDRDRGHIVDIMKTCMEAAGAEYPDTYDGHSIQPMEGLSLTPAMDGKSRELHSEIGWEHHGNKALRSGDWKLVYRRETDWEFSGMPSGQWQLYNVEQDRTELKNLANEQPEKLKEMKELYQKWADRVGVIEYDKLRD